MGFFSRRSRPAAWQADRTELVSAGDIGGDIQVGDSWSLRYVNAALPGALITITYYAAEYDDLPGEFVVQGQVEWMLCEDPESPGDTELWSLVEYEDHYDSQGCFWPAAGDAEAAARLFAGQDLAEGAQFQDWDGEPFRRPEEATA
jgi:hypothetical protein